MAMDEKQSGLYVDLASDFTRQAEVLPGRAPPGTSGTRSRLAGLGFGFWLAVAWIVGITLLAIFANLLPLPNPNTASSSCLTVVPGAGPGPGHILGCDGNSRDVLSRVIYGARVSLVVGFASISIGLLIGGTLGLIAGFFRGPFDEVMNVLVEQLSRLPLPGARTGRCRLSGQLALQRDPDHRHLGLAAVVQSRASVHDRVQRA